MDKISKDTRPAKAGKAMGKAIIENVHLLYLDDNALEYLNTLVSTLQKEFIKRLRREKDIQAKAKYINNLP